MTVSDGVTGGSGAGWSDRFEEGLHPSIERFNASIGFDITLLQQDLDGSVAPVSYTHLTLPTTVIV